MTIETLQGIIDAFLTSQWTSFVNAQTTYYGTHSKYFQGLWSHANIIDNTDESSAVVPDSLDGIPHDQTHDWHDWIGGALDAVPFPARLCINVYETPTGWGWQAHLEVLYNAVVYQRMQAAGEEASTHTIAWHIGE
jgi:hypothetical protein